MVNFTEIELAKQTIKQWIATTPLIKSNELSEQFHCEVFLKLEQLQYTGCLLYTSPSPRDRG
jgi:threonine dehydratase